MRSLNLDSHSVPAPVPASDLHDETSGNRVDDSLDFLGSRSADSNTALLLPGLVRRFGSVDCDPAGRIEFNNILSEDGGDNLLSLATLVGGDGEFGFLSAVRDRNGCVQ